MSRIPVVSISQPHIDQMRSYLNEALTELRPLSLNAAKRGASDDIRATERIEFYIRSALQNMPSEQLPLDL